MMVHSPLENYEFGWQYGYESLIRDRNAATWILVISDDGWQGDTLAIGLSDGMWCSLIIGWGSCAGCDAYQSAEHSSDPAELQKIGDELVASIVRYESYEAMLESFRINAGGSFNKGIFSATLYVLDGGKTCGPSAATCA